MILQFLVLVRAPGTRLGRRPALDCKVMEHDRVVSSSKKVLASGGSGSLSSATLKDEVYRRALT